MKWAAHRWTALKARLGGREDFESETPSTEAPTQGHQPNYSPNPPIPQIGPAERQRIWQKWEAVAPTRMAAFVDPGDACPLDPAGRYIWASHLSASIAPALHTFEVALRNAMHSSLSQHYGQADWFAGAVIFEPDEDKLVKSALRAAKKKAKKKGVTHTPDDVIAELMLGFWCALLNSPYATSVFQPCLARAFQNLPAPLKVRTDLHAKIIEFKRVRNRVFHHEPIWNYPGIDQIEAELWTLAEALYPEFSILSQDQSQFQTIFHDRLSRKQALDQCAATCVANGRIQP